MWAYINAKISNYENHYTVITDIHCHMCYHYEKIEL